MSVELKEFTQGELLSILETTLSIKAHRGISKEDLINYLETGDSGIITPNLLMEEIRERVADFIRSEWTFLKSVATCDGECVRCSDAKILFCAQECELLE